MQRQADHSPGATGTAPRASDLEGDLDRPATVPDRPSLDGLEARWGEVWEREGTYRFDRGAPRERVYSIDTPPPTVSGSLHVGHVFSYTHTDVVARYRRMRGMEVFYPMGWDDNGLPTERRVQNHFGVRCDPAVPYDPDFTPPAEPHDPPIAISRPNFVELCQTLTESDEQAFEELWRRLGLSVDWSMTYQTIDPQARRISQSAFLELLRRDLAYQAEAPTLWDVDFQTAVAQAELEDRERPGAMHRVRFHAESAEADPPAPEPVIETTRPELIAACVALLAHPEDERWRGLVGGMVRSPLFAVPLPVLTHPLVEREKGTGLVMVCTFGDVTDVVWWRELGLPVRAVLGPDGRLLDVPWGGEGWETEDLELARRNYAQLAGLSVNQARRRSVELLRDSGELIGEPTPVTRAVKFFEKGDRPIEIITSRQWFIRTIDHRAQLIERGRELRWHPPYMRARYEDWVGGLNGDWAVSRQRFFGVPFPIWYPLDEQGAVLHEQPILAASLPVDPSTDVPDGYVSSQRGQPGGFVGDPDVMDTWATSSLTPQIAGRQGAEDDEVGLFERVFPMDLRPQAHDIIRTWLFTTVLRSELQLGKLPWSDTAISGWVLDPDRKKMSKSKGNVVTPMHLLEEHGADAVRYWAASGRPGTDTAFDPQQMKVGRRLAVKLLNASKFALADLPPSGELSEPLDRAVVHRLAEVVREATDCFEAYDYARALERTETFFWWFCDYYLELVKGRRYGEGPGTGSVARALRLSLSTFQRLLAPFLPYACEEVWSWWQTGSVHRARWPDAAELNAALGAEPVAGDALEVAADVLREVRKAKSQARRPMRAPVERVLVRDSPARLDALALGRPDLLDAGVIERLDTEAAGEGEELAVEVLLAPGADG